MLNNDKVAIELHCGDLNDPELKFTAQVIR